MLSIWRRGKRRQSTDRNIFKVNKHTNISSPNNHKCVSNALNPSMMQMYPLSITQETLQNTRAHNLLCTEQLSLCPTLFCMHTHTHSLSLSLTHTHSLSLNSLSHTHTHSLSLSTLSLTHTHTLSLSYTHTHSQLPLSHTHTLSLSLSHTHTHTLSHTHTHTLHPHPHRENLKAVHTE